MKINLPNVTLLAVDCTDRINATIRALEFCAERINFGAVKLLCHYKPTNLPDYITHEEIEPICNINQYNKFMFLDLGEHVQTGHVLTVQDHAWIINPDEWDDTFLDWDYIGAPWPIVDGAYMANNGERARVGNGGFSLRSKKLCDLPAKLGWNLREEQGFKNEDGQINCYYRKELLELGIKYAPVNVAARFSYETLVEENCNTITFGFHRNYPKKVV